MTTYNVIVQVGMVSHRDTNLIVLVHDVYREVLGETVTVDDLPVVLGVVSLVSFVASVSGVVLYDGTVDLIDEVLYELRLQVVGV